MSKVLEKSIGGFLNSLIGSGTSLVNTSLESYSATSGLSYVTLGLINFVERLEAARKISKQEEEDIVAEEYQEWLRQASRQNTKNEIIVDFLCRSLIAFSRGHYFTNLHINAIKLTQSDKLLLKKTGYLYISRTMAPGSDLTVLLVNTVQRDLASANVIQVALGLNLIPTILSLDISPLICNSIILCLGHQQPYIKRRSAMLASSFISECLESQNAFALLVPHLTQLVTDPDPSVAIASTITLSKAFKSISNLMENVEFRNEIAISCSHILLQATSGSLSQHYNVGPINAPFVQVQMLRSIRNLSSKDWSVPAEVESAIESVLMQPWGGRNLCLYMTLLEGIMTVTGLPRNEALISQSLKIILGFLKSSLIDFKYLGIRALTCVFETLEDAITQAHLEAVLECLDSTSKLLQSRTIRLMCSMANIYNYQAICVTLFEFSLKTNNSSTKDLVTNHLSDILQRINVDIPWCVSFLSPLLAAPQVNKRFLEALRITISKGMEEDKTEGEKVAAIMACNKLFGILLQGDHVPLSKLTTIACILNLLFSTNPESVIRETVHTFIDKAIQIDQIQDENDEIYDCLLNCGLFVPQCNDKVKNVLNSYVKIGQVHSCLRSKEKLLLLNDCDLTKRVLAKKTQILSGDFKPDVTLTFYDDLVVKCLEKGAQPYKPFTIKTRNFSKDRHRRTGSFNPFDVKATSITHSADKDSVSPSGSLRSSLCGVSTISGNSQTSRSVWSPQGRLKNESENDVNSSGSGCVEIAHEAEESFVIEADLDKRSAASTFLDSQKVDLTQALLKGLGFSKN